MRNHSVFIPQEIWELPINIEQRIILSAINYYHKRDGQCILSNQYFADEIGKSTQRVSSLIHSLEEEHYISIKTMIVDPPCWKTEYQISTVRELKILLTQAFTTESLSVSQNPLVMAYNKAIRKCSPNGSAYIEGVLTLGAMKASHIVDGKYDFISVAGKTFLHSKPSFIALESIPRAKDYKTHSIDRNKSVEEMRAGL